MGQKPWSDSGCGCAARRSSISGALYQDCCVDQPIFDMPKPIETLSAGMTLKPREVIAGCTPASCASVSPRNLRSSDRVAVTIEPFGTLGNHVE